MSESIILESINITPPSNTNNSVTYYADLAASASVKLDALLQTIEILTKSIPPKNVIPNLIQSARLFNEIANTSNYYAGMVHNSLNQPIYDPTPALTSEPEVGSTMTGSIEAGTTTQHPTIAFRIQLARENLDMSKAALANKLDLTPECIADWEDGNCPLEASYVIPLASALKCDPMWLLIGNPVDVKPAQPAPINVMKGADLANIGVRINNRRNQIMMSIDKLAEKIDTSGAMILEWEAGKAIPHSGYIDKLAKALNTTVTWLITGNHITDKIRES